MRLAAAGDNNILDVCWPNRGQTCAVRSPSSPLCATQNLDRTIDHLGRRSSGLLESEENHKYVHHLTGCPIYDQLGLAYWTTIIG